MIPLLSGGRRPETDADKKVCANPALEESTLRNFELFKLVISAINGLAIGGGMELPLEESLRKEAELA